MLDQVDLKDEPLLLQLSDRQFPSAKTLPPPAKDERLDVRRIAVKVPLDARLYESIFAMLRWNGLPASADRETCVKSYNASLEQLLRCRREFDHLLATTGETSLRYRDSSPSLRRHRGEIPEHERERALENGLKAVLETTRAEWLPIRNILSARLISQSPTEVRRALASGLHEATQSFSKQCCRLMSRMVDEEVFGLVEWFPNQCAAYHFFKRTVTQQIDLVTKTTVANREDTTTRGSTRVLIARHEHAVMNAIRTTLGNTKVPMPPDVREVVRSIPVWLQPLTSVVDGDLFRERIVEREVEREHWSETIARDVTVYGWDPCVLIGPYVVTGWGPREIEIELKRQESERVKRGLRRRRLLLPITFCLSIALGGLALFATYMGNQHSFPMWIAFVIGVGATITRWQFHADKSELNEIELRQAWFDVVRGTVSYALSLGILAWFIAWWSSTASWSVLFLLAAIMLSLPSSLPPENDEEGEILP